MRYCAVRYPNPDSPTCSGIMQEHQGAYKCQRCGCVDAPMDEAMPTLAGGGARLRVTADFDRQTVNRLAFWWWRQVRGYGEFDVDGDR